MERKSRVDNTALLVTTPIREEQFEYTGSSTQELNRIKSTTLLLPKEKQRYKHEASNGDNTGTVYSIRPSTLSVTNTTTSNDTTQRQRPLHEHDKHDPTMKLNTRGTMTAANSTKQQKAVIDASQRQDEQRTLEKNRVTNTATNTATDTATDTATNTATNRGNNGLFGDIFLSTLHD